MRCRPWIPQSRYFFRGIIPVGNFIKFAYSGRASYLRERSGPEFARHAFSSFLAGSACTVFGGFSCSFSFASSTVMRLRDWITLAESDLTFPASCIDLSAVTNLIFEFREARSLFVCAFHIFYLVFEGPNDFITTRGSLAQRGPFFILLSLR